MTSKPILKGNKNPDPKSKVESSKVAQSSTDESLFDEVPLMFQAQIKGRCQIQFNEKGKEHTAYQWVNQWTKAYELKAEKPVSNSQQKSNNLALQRSQPPKNNSPEQTPPKFGKNVETKKYKINWRLVSNAGQDNFIRPIIGAKGYPYYSGTSMKGIFRRACNDAQAIRYCGEDNNNNNDSTKPGILRFHGGYPTDTTWINNLVDPVHSQQEKQVIKDQTTNANVQLSLYQTTLKFGISSTEKLEEKEWQAIWDIWEKALSLGLGSRTSAGYGYFEKITPAHTLVEVELAGQGLSSVLLDQAKTPEFRVNMFKAVLRGHTLRLLGGMTNQATAINLTQKLWGGIGENSDDNGGNIGLLGVTFDYNNQDLTINNKSVYNLKKGTLRIYLQQPNLVNDTQKHELTELAKAMIQFAMLFGGFGKSWRRVDHSLFFPQYLTQQGKRMIGCHWKFINFKNLSISINNLEDVTNFINQVIKLVKTWANQQENLGATIANNWRESWYKDAIRGVQVWGRIANDNKSHAVKWFHQKYQGSNTIKKTSLTGQMGTTGRIWHRMYPLGDKYIELLTIFPDDSNSMRNFLQYLGSNASDFERLW
jgi:CRISPR-associated protein Cmr6